MGSSSKASKTKKSVQRKLDFKGVKKSVKKSSKINKNINDSISEEDTLLNCTKDSISVDSSDIFSLITKEADQTASSGSSSISIEAELRAFDLNYEFGPCCGLSRLERWIRAHKLGLNPPERVKQLLEISHSNKESLWHDLL